MSAGALRTHLTSSSLCFVRSSVNGQIRSNLTDRNVRRAWYLGLGPIASPGFVCGARVARASSDSGG